MTDERFQVARLDDLERIPRFWLPIRRPFGIQAFGVNAWVADAAGDEIIGDHAELSGHEELYLVVRGSATFTVAGDEIDAPTGTIVFVRDPATRRKAAAREAGTTILTVGAKPGEPFRVSGWEAGAEMWPLDEAGDYEGARKILAEARERDPTEDPGLLYNLACMESLSGHHDDAIGHLREAVEAEERFRELAQSDSDLDAIRERPDFPA